MSLFGQNLDGSSPPTMAENVDLSAVIGAYQPEQIPAWIHIYSPMTVTYVPYAAPENNLVTVTVTVTADMVPYILPSLVRRLSAVDADGEKPEGGIIASWWRKRQ